MSESDKEIAAIEVQASWFRQVRQAHRSEVTEDYVELIDELSQVNGEARLADISQRVGVSNPTSAKILNRLQQEGYIVSKPYRAIFLTAKGEQLAKKCRQRHQIVVDFLKCLGVSEVVAQADAEGIEHHISPETLKKMKQFIK